MEEKANTQQPNLAGLNIIVLLLSTQNNSARRGGGGGGGVVYNKNFTRSHERRIVVLGALTG